MNYTSLSLKTISELRECYDTHSQKFSSTRKKNRPELNYILERISVVYEQFQRPLTIVELGCGDGRLYRKIQDICPEMIKSYSGIDISDQLLAIAKNSSTETSTTQRIHDDMI